MIVNYCYLSSYPKLNGSGFTSEVNMSDQELPSDYDAIVLGTGNLYYTIRNITIVVNPV